MPDAPTSSVTITPLTTLADFERCVSLQQEAWQMADAADAVPAHLLIAVSNKGGLTLGAWVAQTLVGFVFGFLGQAASGRLLHHSHMAAVLPAYRSRGVGYRLKLAQARAVADQGLDVITWTYDPLEAGNAHFNLTRLGAVARTYQVNRYGALNDTLNHGLESDRFEVEWWLRSPAVQARLAGKQPPAVSFPTPSQQIAAVWVGDLPHPAPLPDVVAGADLLVEIPPRFQQIKQDSPDLALRWRLHLRQCCHRAFAAGMVAVGLVREPGTDRTFYLFHPASSLPPL